MPPTPPPHDETTHLPTHRFCWRGVINSKELGHLPGQSDFPEFTGNGWEEDSCIHLPGIADWELGFFNTFECPN